MKNVTDQQILQVMTTMNLDAQAAYSHIRGDSKKLNLKRKMILNSQAA